MDGDNFTQTGKFYVYPDSPVLYVRRGVQVDSRVRLSKEYESFKADGMWYDPYVKARRRWNVRDCLQFAEGMVDNTNYRGDVCRFTVQGSEQDFGYEDADNMELAEEYGQDEYANPRAGQAYAIVRPFILKNRMPFHIAYVLYEDRDDRITLEDNASSKQGDEPVFDFYSTTDPENSFYERYAKEYKARGIMPSVLVLTPKSQSKTKQSSRPKRSIRKPSRLAE